MRFFHTLLLTLLCCTLQAQTSYRFRQYGREEGLSNLNVNCAMQDSRGLVWVGTNIGLNRFDGIRFHTYFASNTQDVWSLPSNPINSLAEDAEAGADDEDDARVWLTDDELVLADEDSEAEYAVESSASIEHEIKIRAEQRRQNLTKRVLYLFILSSGEVP